MDMPFEAGALLHGAGMVLVALAAALHVFIAGVEVLGWTGPVARRLFNLEPAFARQTREMAANQGFYNLMLAVEMIVGIVGALAGAAWGLPLAVAGAASTAAAGAFLYLTSPDKRSSAVRQLAPGLLGTVLLVLGAL